MSHFLSVFGHLIIQLIAMFNFSNTYPSVVYAADNDDNPSTQSAEDASNKIIRNETIDNTASLLLKDEKASKFNFKKFDAEKIVKQGRDLGNELWMILQAYSWPLFVISIGLGLGFLFLGALFGSRWFKKTGGFLLLLAVGKVILTNYAPELTSSILSFIEGTLK